MAEVWGPLHGCPGVVVAVWARLLDWPSFCSGVEVVRVHVGLVHDTLGADFSSKWQEELPEAGCGPHQLKPWQSA